ncbi:MAG: dihydroneopterin aldolase [Leptospirillum sp.]|nr:dihydroneopterin aldolase [Nitrospiraceae bacterium]
MTVQKEILLSKLMLSMHMGVSDKERSQPQNILLSGVFSLDPKRNSSHITDRIDDTVDYALLATTIREHSISLKPYLLENLGYSLGKNLLDLFPGISAISLTLTKVPSPLLTETGADVSVRITLNREGTI